MANKVQFGLSNVYFALLTFDDGGNAIYGVPHKHPGAVNLTLEPSGSESVFYADNIAYYRTTANQGYSGTMEFALFDDWFRLNVLKDALDSNGVLVENASVSPAAVAMLYQVNGDQMNSYRVLYNLQVSRGSDTAATIGETTEPQTQTMNITASPLPNTMLVRAHTTDKTPAETVNNWFTEVYIPEGEYQADASLTALSLGALTLDPAFDSATTTYTTTTTNATNTISAVAAEGATIAITLNGSTVQNGASLTWDDGENTVIITVTNGDATQQYTITVTKSS